MHRFVSRSGAASITVSVIALVAALQAPALADHQAHSAALKVHAVAFSFQGHLSSNTRTVLSVEGLTIRAHCDSKGSPVITATTAVTNADLLGRVIDGAGKVHPIADDAFHHGSVDDLTAGAKGDSDASATVNYEIAQGNVVTVEYAFDNAPTLNGKNVCTMYGTAISD
jgi:hypothetical protein